MSHILIDRRKNDKNKSLANRNRYVRRVRDQVRESVKDLIRDGGIKENASEAIKKVKITNKKSLEQPEFTYRKDTGRTDHVVGGNKEFRKGDQIDKPDEDESNGDFGSQGSPEGGGFDVFEFGITKEEFLDIFFEDLELPDLVKKELASTDEYILKRAGFTHDGNPSRLNILRSMRQAKGRRIALRTPKKKRLQELTEQLALTDKALESCSDPDFKKEELIPLRDGILAEIAKLKKRIKAVPFIDNIDLRYNLWERKPQPATKAVLFGIMDVSGSMSEWKKEMAKRFFLLMYLFLEKKYEKIDIVWIRHTDDAKEVDETEFFHSKETGGTIVSTALELMVKIQRERYPTNIWNVYGVQISDGDNFQMDNEKTKFILKNQILQFAQYFAYVEVQEGQQQQDLLSIIKTIERDAGHNLFTIYGGVALDHDNLTVAIVTGPETIYPVFRALFEKKKPK